MKKILETIDNYLCKYIGLEKEEEQLDSLLKRGNHIFLCITESFKRYVRQDRLDNFLSSDLEEINQVTREKLGISMGKVLAKNLVVSFESISINMVENNGDKHGSTI